MNNTPLPLAPDGPGLPDRLPEDDATRVRREAHHQEFERSSLNTILDEALVAHVGVIRDGRPLVLPFACARDGDTLLLHGSTGSGLMRLAEGEPVCVEVTHLDGLVFARTTFESSMQYRSAVVLGVAHLVPAEEKKQALEVLVEHLFPGRDAEVRPSSAKELAATMVLRVSLEQASVKTTTGPPEIDPEDTEPRDVWAGILPLRTVAGTPLPSPDVPPGVEVSRSVRAAAARTGRLSNPEA